MTLFNRVVVVDVGTLRITGLRIAFKIVKTLTKEPNTLDLQIYNLSEDSRRRVQETGASVRVTAGYVDNTELLFTGDATVINHTREGADWITRLQSGDGVKALRQTRVNESFASGTNIVDAMKVVAGKIGVGLGNIVDELRSGNVRNTLTQYAKGYVASGVAGDELDVMARTMGRELSVQDGALQLSQPGQAVGATVVVLRADTGLIGSPEVAEVGSAETGKTLVTKARSLIQQKMLPGRKVSITSRAVNGLFRIEKVTFCGDTHAQPWYADLEMKAVA